MIWLALGVLFVQIGVYFFLWGGQKRMTQLPVGPFPAANWPSVSIVVAARNEEATLGIGLGSLSQLDYPDLEIIVVNDRSTDGTGALLDRLAQLDGRIRPVHLSQLPPGWLGKNHALQAGSLQATGELILFTDADVEIESEFLRSSVRLLVDKPLDLLAAMPRLDSSNPHLVRVLGSFFYAFSLFAPPWKSKDPRSKTAVGIGAFNLMHRSAYEHAGRHEKLKMRVDDDITLARNFKEHGLQIDCVSAENQVRVEWYADVPGLMRGLEKNYLAAFNYSIVGGGLGLLANIVTFHGPFVVPFFTSGESLRISLAAIALYFVNYATVLSANGIPVKNVVFMPYAMAVLTFIFARAYFLTLVRQGIYWRGTFYSLRDLKS